MHIENVRTKMMVRIKHMVSNAIIKDRRFLDDEQLIRSEQLNVLEEIFNANVRDTEITELSSHFAGVLRKGHPCHLAIWGKTGTGKTLTLRYFLNFLSELCQSEGIPIRYEHLDLSTPCPCFRALNDLACLFNASKRYKKGISLEELMLRIEAKLSQYQGYLILFIDEIDNVKRDRDTFLTFLVRRLPQRIKAKLILVLVSNRLNWPDNLDPRAKSFLKLNELIFEPYDAVDLQHILRIRIEKALNRGAVEPGVIEKIAAMASLDHGDARKAVAMLAKSAYIAEKDAAAITLKTVDQAAADLDKDRYISLLRTAPVQLQAAMAAVIQAAAHNRGKRLGTGLCYDQYKSICRKASLRIMTARAFGDLISELDMYSLLRSRVVSRGRYGRTREIILELPGHLINEIMGMLSESLSLA
jgi:archaeal cell division control protein 6